MTEERRYSRQELMARWDQRRERSLVAIDAYLREHQVQLLATVNDRVHVLPDGRWAFSEEDFWRIHAEYGAALREVFLQVILSALFDGDEPVSASRNH